MMEFEKILDECMAFEGAITSLIDTVAKKKRELHDIEKNTLEYTELEFKKLDKKELEYWAFIEELKAKKDGYESEIKQYSEVNEKLSELVSISQRNAEENKEVELCNHDQLTATSVLQDFQLLKSEFLKLHQDASIFQEEQNQNAFSIKESIEYSKGLVIDLHKNANTLRVIEQQLKYAEQQFDIILNQLPWNSLPSTYFQQLRKSSNEYIRDFADTLELQTNEINDLNESLNIKKKQKLTLLEDLAKALNDFTTKRQDAILMLGYHKDYSINSDN